MKTTVNDTSMFQVGDLVVGSSDPSKSVYSATGSKLIDNGVAIYGDSSDIESAQKELSEALQRNGGKIIQTSTHRSGKPAKKNKSQKIKASLEPVQPPYILPKEPTAVTYKTVQFENAFGKMKAKVEHVVEHDAAFMLVFSDADSVIFEPKAGESLIFYSIDSYSYNVYYPGVTFDSPDSSKKYMILFKVPEEN
jgi:hypothetical protein